MDKMQEKNLVFVAIEHHLKNNKKPYSHEEVAKVVGKWMNVDNNKKKGYHVNDNGVSE